MTWHVVGIVVAYALVVVALGAALDAIVLCARCLDEARRTREILERYNVLIRDRLSDTGAKEDE